MLLLLPLLLLLLPLILLTVRGIVRFRNHKMRLLGCCFSSHPFPLASGGTLSFALLAAVWRTLAS